MLTDTWLYNLATGLQLSQAAGYLVAALVLAALARVAYLRIDRANTQEEENVSKALCGFAAMVSVLCVSEMLDQIWWSLARETVDPHRLGWLVDLVGTKKWDFEQSGVVPVIKGSTAVLRWLTLVPLGYLVGFSNRQVLLASVAIMALNVVGLWWYAS